MHKHTHTHINDREMLSVFLNQCLETTKSYFKLNWSLHKTTELIVDEQHTLKRVCKVSF